MNRRDFGLFAGTGLAATAVAQTATAQSAKPDPALLTTTLTPYGAERAGNADGSIPAWTGGATAPATTPTQDAHVPGLFASDKVLYTVDASNLSQYENFVAPGIQALITKYGYSLKVYPTRRSAGAPQYVYDNIAKNVTRAQLDPRGGRFGFTGAFGGIPFPIIDTSDPQIGGVQLIWNHLTSFQGYSTVGTFSPAIVMTNGTPVLTNGTLARALYPYYDPNGSADAYEGYFSKEHAYTKAPAAAEGQESMVWISTNVFVKPDIVWELLNGQGRVRKAPNEQYDTPDPLYNGLSNIDESQAFYGSPQKYDWTYIAKKEMLIPYNNNAVGNHTAQELAGPKCLNADIERWEKHRVWVVEANLHPGEHNVLAKRRFYIDEDTGAIIVGEAYDHDLNLARVYTNPALCIPSVPMVVPAYIFVFDVITGNYCMQGDMRYPPYDSAYNIVNQPDSFFEAQQMAANAAF